MVISLGMVVPLTMLTAWRLQQLTPSRTRLGFGEANRLILTASVLNMVLPSKMGDIVKAYFIKERGHLEGSLSLSLVVFEKACDMLSLLLWCAFGLTLYPQIDWLFWIMTASVVFGLIVGSLLIASRQFANFLFQFTGRFVNKKMRLKIAKLRDSWSEMLKYCCCSRCTLYFPIYITSTGRNSFFRTIFINYSEYASNTKKILTIPLFHSSALPSALRGSKKLPQYYSLSI